MATHATSHHGEGRDCEAANESRNTSSFHMGGSVVPDTLVRDAKLLSQLIMRLFRRLVAAFQKRTLCERVLIVLAFILLIVYWQFAGWNGYVTFGQVGCHCSCERSCPCSVSWRRSRFQDDGFLPWSEQAVEYVERDRRSLELRGMTVDDKKHVTCISTYQRASAFADGKKTGKKIQEAVLLTINSWLNTTRSRAKGTTELWLVDDGSDYLPHKELLRKVELENPELVKIVLKPYNGGISRAKNTCLRLFFESNARFISLVDHDVVFKKAGWMDAYEGAMRAGVGHLAQWHGDEQNNFEYNNSPLLRMTPHLGGYLYFFERDTIVALGAYPEFKNKWGWEHAELTWRARWANMMPRNGYIDLANGYEYADIAEEESVFSNKEKEAQQISGKAEVGETVKLAVATCQFHYDLVE